MKLAGGDILREVQALFVDRTMEFPRNGTLVYPDVLQGWIAALSANLLRYVTAGGIAIDGGHLTLHDEEHIRRVRQLASDLIDGMNGDLRPYELVLLICAIYMHDIGNILGRAGHERKIGEVLRVVGAPTGFDTIEVRTSQQIALVHGGRINGSKDTISTLPEDATILGKKIRPRLLAAIVRLADELADDPARANRIQMATGTLPRDAEVYHVFAAHCHSQVPAPESRTIELHLDFSDPSLFERKLGKGSLEVYLLDEIFERSIKTYHEARYCSRFLRPFLDFDRVSVDISIFDRDGPLLQRIRFALEEHGYQDQAEDIYSLAPELDRFQGNGRLTAEYLATLLSATKPIAEPARSSEPRE